MKFNQLAWIGCLFLALALAVNASDAVAPNAAKKLVGLWASNDPEFVHTIEFTNDGKFCFQITAGDINIQKEGTYKLSDDTTIVTSIPKDDNTVTTRRLKIKSLTEKDLVVENEQAESRNYSRK